MTRQQTLLEAFEANQEEYLKQKFGICWNFWQIQAIKNTTYISEMGAHWSK